jgi:hypothetical protein
MSGRARFAATFEKTTFGKATLDEVRRAPTASMIALSSGVSRYATSDEAKSSNHRNPTPANYRRA